MLFNITKQKSLALIQIFVAVLMLTAPSFLSLFSLKGAVYLTFTISALLLVLRVKANEKIVLSLKHTVYLLLIGYGIISFFWVSNISGHFLYLFAIGTVCVLTMLLKEYFIENNSDSFKRRIAYLISISGFTYCLYNAIYWIAVVVPVAGNDGFRKGLLSGDFSGIFAVISIACTISLYKGNSRLRKFLISFSLILMAFCLLMTKSLVSWMFAFAFAALHIIKRLFSEKNGKKTKKYMIFSAIIIVCYFAGILMIALAGEKGAVLTDVFLFASKHIFGAGGGFLTAKDTFTDYTQIDQMGTGLFLYLFSASGICGVLSCVFLVIRSVRAFIKLKNTESALGIICLITLLLLPFGQSFATVILIVGLNTYIEYCADLNLKLQLKKENVKRIINIASVILTITASATVLCFMEMGADRDFENGRYEQAYETYKIVSNIDVFDSRNSAMAAVCAKNHKTLLSTVSDDALKLIDKAIKNDRNNLGNYEKKAEIHFVRGNFNESVAQYRVIIDKSAVNDKYNLSMTRILYEIIVNNPKGSSETKRAYEEIVNIARLTENLDIKKEINDLADKALVYTKGELSDEGKIAVE